MKQLFSRASMLIAACALFTLGCDSQALPARISGFSAPESVLYDAQRDVYWVSNIGAGGPFARDNDGFISRVDPDGHVSRRFISQERAGVVLDAPKGLAVVGHELYVSDIDRVRVFDANSGAPLRDIVIPNSDFLNDIAVGANGTLYVSDSAFDANFQATGRDAVYRLVPGAPPERWAAGADFGNPNGLYVSNDAVWLVTLGSGELIRFDLDGKIRARYTAPRGSLDGIEAIDKQRFLISSWDASALYIATRDGQFRVEREGVESPADLGFDTKRKRVLLPLMNSGEVLVDIVRAE